MGFLISRGIFQVLNQILVAADNTCQKDYKCFIPTGICETFGERIQLWQEIHLVMTLASITTLLLPLSFGSFQPAGTGAWKKRLTEPVLYYV